MVRAPRAFLGLLGVLDLVRREHLDVALSGDPGDPLVRDMLREVHRRFLPGRVLSVSGDQLLPLHEGRGLSLGRPLAFVCRGRTCAAPVGTSRELGDLLQGAPVPM